MSKDFWNSRYSELEFAYVTKPNGFFQEQINKIIPGKVLFLGEGEHKNRKTNVINFFGVKSNQ
jgi:hypothetical protein